MGNYAPKHKEGKGNKAWRFFGSECLVNWVRSMVRWCNKMGVMRGVSYHLDMLLMGFMPFSLCPYLHFAFTMSSIYKSIVESKRLACFLVLKSLYAKQIAFHSVSTLCPGAQSRNIIVVAVQLS